MRGRRAIAVLVALLIAAVPVLQARGAGEAAGKSVLRMTLEEAEQKALENSHALESQRYVKESASESASGQHAKQFPQLGFSGNAQFMSKVGLVDLPAGGQMQIGDHHAWSVGPILEWTAFDAGALAKQTQSLRHAAESQDKTYASSRRKTLLTSRLSYFGVQLALKQLRLVANSLALARSEYHDVNESSQAGLASRLDLVTSHQEVVDRTRDFQDAQAELAVQLRELLAVTGQEQDLTPTFPVGVGMSVRAGPTPADLLVDVEPIERSMTIFLPMAALIAPVEQHPSVAAAEKQREAAIAASQSIKAGRWPKVSVLGKSDFEYPNFAELSTIQQNTLTLGLRMPLFDWGLITHQAKSQQFQANAAEEQRQQLIVDLNRNLGQARDRIAALKAQRATCAAAVRDASESAKLVYESYRAGQLPFLEVQRANFRSLSAQVESARTDVALVTQIARLVEIVSPEGE